MLLTEKTGYLQAMLSGAEIKLDSVSRELVDVKSELAVEKTNLKIKTEQCQK